MKKLIFIALILCGFGAAFAQCEQSVFAKKDGYALYQNRDRPGYNFRISVKSTTGPDELGFVSSTLQQEEIWLSMQMSVGGIYTLKWDCGLLDWTVSNALFECLRDADALDKGGAKFTYDQEPISYPNLIGEIEGEKFGTTAPDHICRSSSQFKKENKPDLSTTHTTNRRAVREETITTPAGTFKTWLYESDEITEITDMPETRHVWKVQEWLSLDLNLIIKYHREDERGSRTTHFELIDYSK